MANRIAIAEQFGHAFNERRYAPNDLRDFISEEVVVRVPATGQEFHGYEGVAQFDEGWVVPFSDAQVEDQRSTDHGEYVETRFRGTGTFDGLFATPQGTVTGDGSRRVDVAFTNRYWIEGDKIVQVEVDFDPTEFMRQMGLG